MATKLALIDPDLLVRLLHRTSTTSGTTPSGAVLPGDTSSGAALPPDTRLTEMTKINNGVKLMLDDKNIDPAERIRRFNEMLTRYGAHSENYYKTPTGPPQLVDQVTPSGPEVEATSAGTMPDKWEEDVVESIPLTMQKNARLLLKTIKASGRMSWDEHGRLVRQGRTIPGTNIMDLVHAVVRQRKKSKLTPGLDHFISGLRDMNTASELMRGAQNVAYVTSSTKSSTKSSAGASPYEAPLDGAAALSAGRSSTPKRRTVKQKLEASTIKLSKKARRRRQLDYDGPDDEEYSLYSTPGSKSSTGERLSKSWTHW